MNQHFASAATRGLELRYDNVTIRLHWAMVLLVAVQWLGAELVDFLPGKPLHQLYWSGHIVIGLLFALIVVVHLWWRLARGARLADANTGVAGLITRAVHGALALLPLLLVALGLGIVLARGANLFGLVVPALPGGSRALGHLLHGIHEWTAHVVVALAAGHAGAALFHHYVLRDGVLVRMAPAVGVRGAKPLH